MTAPESLTAEERELAVRPGRAFPEDAALLAKLLRIHDRQAARIEELERQMAYAEECALERSERD